MRPVTVGEVVRCAKPSCKSCHGTGAVAIWAFVDANTQKRREDVCSCARKRFLKANSAKVDTANNDWQWKEEEVAA
jgi:RecJ-like exonuclease